MALINCPDCRTEVSDSAEKCPKCGRRIAQKQSATGVAAAIIIGLIVGTLLLKGCGFL